MRTLFFCLILFGGTQLALGQKKIEVNNLNNKDNLVKGSFAYKDFYPGKVVFKDHTTADAQLNYSRLTEEIVFMDPEKNDIAALGKPETIEMIVIGDDIYRYVAGAHAYVVKMTNYPNVNLNARIKCKMVEASAVGAYGGSSNTTAVSSAGSYGEFKPVNASDGSLRYKANENETYSFVETFYLSNNDNAIVYADKKGFSKMFPKHDDELKSYIATNKTNFMKQEDVEKLVQYAQSLK